MSLGQNQGAGSSALHVDSERVGREASENRNALLVAFAVANERAPALCVSIEMHVLAIERLQLCPANTGSIESSNTAKSRGVRAAASNFSIWSLLSA
jgi:hypothetical protein